jgi:hypothetical protein
MKRRRDTKKKSSNCFIKRERKIKKLRRGKLGRKTGVLMVK